jgi:hypothetical protein
MPAVYDLHYIGAGLYTPAIFTKEALKHGINRNMPPNFLRKLKYKDIVLLAFYDSSKEVPEARVFGAMSVTGVSVNGSDALRSELRKRLKIASTDISLAGTRVVRRCGAYFVHGVDCVTNTPEEIVVAAKAIAKELKEHVKFAVSGSFTPLDEFVITPAVFRRGLLQVELAEPVNVAVPTAPHPTVTYIYDYQQQLYVKKSKKKDEQAELELNA